MNKLIIEQLNNCKIAQIPEYDDSTIELHIPKGVGSVTNPVEDILLDHYYLIEVEDYIIKPYDGFTLHDNWNKGVIPTDKRMKCEICQIMGKMVKVEAIGANDSKSWSGWLPRKSFKVIEEIK